MEGAAGSADLLTRAIAAYRQAVADPAGAATTTSAMLLEAREQPDVEALVIALRARAWSVFRTLSAHEAKDLLNQAARLARRSGLDVRLGDVLVSRIAVNQELGRFRSAKQDVASARALMGGTPSAELEFQSAVLSQNTGQLTTAAAGFRLVLAGGGAEIDIQAKSMNNLALIESEFGHAVVALDLVRQAQLLAPRIGKAIEAYFAESRAHIMAKAGRLPESLELFERARHLYERASLPPGELMMDQARAMSDLRLLPEAIAAGRRYLAEFDTSGAQLMRAEAELNIGGLALLAGDFSAAATAAANAEQAFREQRRAGWAAKASILEAEALHRTEKNLSLADLRRVRRAAATLERVKMVDSAVDAHFTAARIAVTLKQVASATRSLERAKELTRRGSLLTRVKGRVAGAVVAAFKGDDRQTLHHCRTGLADLDRHRAALASIELRVLAADHGAELGQIGLRALMRRGTPHQVFAWMERTRAASLLAVQPSHIDGVEDELALLHSLRAEIDSLADGSPALLERHAAVEAHLRQQSWTRTAGVSSSVRATTTASIRSALDGETLVEYGVLEDHIFAAVVSASRVQLVHLGPLDAVSQELDALLFLLRLLSQPRRPGTAGLLEVVEQRLARLRTLLLDPLAIPVGANLVIVPIGVLQRVPWSALVSGPVSVTPSASFWADARRRRPALDGVALVAGPGLPSAYEEVGQLAAVHERATVLRPPHSTVETVVSALKVSGLAHLACHGFIRSDNPMYSALQLTNGSLTIQELELRDVAPHRIVLAACETAAEVSFAGGEMLGFVSALLARGTAGIVASTIPVPDASAVPLMVSLHQQLRGGETMATALHLARAAVDRKNPLEMVNWCGFTAYGAA